MKTVFRLKSAQYLIDTSTLVEDYHTLTQLHLCRCAHGYSSPLWMTAAYARQHGLSIRFLSTPINVWAPGCGETFSPAIMTHFSSSPSFNSRCADSVSTLPHPPTLPSHTTAISLCVFMTTERNSTPHYEWCECPKVFRPLFAPHNLHRLWVTSRMLSCNSAYRFITVHTPHYHAQLLNVDQLVDCPETRDITDHHYPMFLRLRSSATLPAS